MSWTLSTTISDFVAWKSPSDYKPIDGEDPMKHRARDGGSLACPGTFCRYGTISHGGTWILDVLPHGVRIATMTFTMLIFLVILVSAVVKCFRKSSGLTTLIGRHVQIGKHNSRGEGENSEEVYVLDTPSSDTTGIAGEMRKDE